MSSYYLWRGVDAIEDLEDCETDQQARAALEKQTGGDWTLWKREGMTARLLGVKLCGSGETFQFNTHGGE